MEQLDRKLSTHYSLPDNRIADKYSVSAFNQRPCDYDRLTLRHSPARNTITASGWSLLVVEAH